MLLHHQRQRLLLAAVLFVVAAAHLAAGADSPPEMFISVDQVKNISDTATLNCTVTERNGYSLVWLRKNRDPSKNDMTISMDDLQALRDSRYSLNVTNGRRVNLLIIENIQPEDSAIYECQLIVSTTVSITKRVELTVRTPAQVDLTAAIADHQVATRAGAAATLACKANGFPRPSVHWVRDNGALMPGGGDKYMGNPLQLAAVRPQDRGTYWCVADNGVGTSDRRSMRLEVVFVPRVRTPRPRVAQALGYDIELECVVEAYPAPAIEWYRRSATTGAAADANQTLLQADGGAAEQGYEIRTDAGADEQTVSVLRVRGVQSKHYGQYACRATNAAGTATAAMELYKNDVPDINFAGMLPNSGSSMHQCIASLLMLLLVRLFF